jgi:hypothetical protein
MSYVIDKKHSQFKPNQISFKDKLWDQLTSQLTYELGFAIGQKLWNQCWYNFGAALIGAHTDVQNK